MTQKDISQQPYDYISFNTQSLRAASGFSRQQLIDLMREGSGLSMSPTTLRRIESGDQQAKAVEAAALASAFGIGLEEFITKPVNGELSKYFNLMEKLEISHMKMWGSARTVLMHRSQAKKLLKDETSPELKISSISQKMRDFIEGTEEQGKLAKMVVSQWQPYKPRESKDG